ncbi:uncharacterized protein F5891DRAFT_1184351 [Suillus fuscotomentosus]|uniref:CxC1-like cysteine cluster associated with KDZ transposases domain-containing protein n=1 Tax=Suillus fuscotomentosus TaxID=1912939 RepID=A0AAD4HQU4_9AGAM|nr:uncharacterized protein F5891DRAFT_1184351 [Suillus fuscotomentosus]KAG1904169.1 hypothetical protein F5891DRAFT_1184351 [Suillus fuscotomentosus]
MSYLTPRPTRKAQIVTSGLGHHFVSPRKARDKRKTQTLVELPGAEAKRRRLLAEMKELMKPRDDLEEQNLQVSSPHPSHNDTAKHPQHVENDDATALHFKDVETFDEPSVDIPAIDTPVKRRIAADRSASLLYGNWSDLIPTLISPLLLYLGQTQGKALEKTHSVISACAGTLSCTPKRTTLMCLFFDRYASIDVLSCMCSTLLQVLLHHGLFPTAPSQPRMAVSVDLLSFYRALFECSCDAINALASALKNHYSRRGFQVTDTQGQLIRDPFCWGLGYAVQWFDILQIQLERQLETILQHSRNRITNFQASLHKTDFPPFTSLHPGRCAPLLVQRCPACFGGLLHGRPMDEGGDIHVATDGNFHHCHRRAAGDCPPFYDPTYFIPKNFIDKVGHHIDAQCKHPPKVHTPIVPDEAVDQCEMAYEAADGKKQKAAMDNFDDTGIMALICRHDIPLFFANIDSPGEQQKYSVALLQHLFSLLPPEATVVALYDVGCVLARSLAKYEILPETVTKRLRFATTAMHAYGHEWACQLVYNP